MMISISALLYELAKGGVISGLVAMRGVRYDEIGTRALMPSSGLAVEPIIGVALPATGVSSLRLYSSVTFI